MAQGETKIFNEVPKKEKEGAYSLADNWQIVFISDTYASVGSDLTNPTTALVNITSGGNVAASYSLTGESISRSGVTTTFDAANIGTITKSATNPVDVRCAVLRNATVSNDMIQIWDCTVDGTTALDLINNDLTFNFGASGINQVANASA